MKKAVVSLAVLFFIFFVFNNLAIAAGPSNRMGGVRSEQQQAPKITVLSPNGGEVWEIGKTYRIKWQGHLDNGSTLDIDLADYSMPRAPFADDSKAIAHGIPARNGSYVWNPTYSFLTNGSLIFSPGDNFKVRITEVRSNGTYGVQGESYDYFTVQIRTAVSISVPPCKEISLELYDLNLISFRVDGRRVRGTSVEFRNSQTREVELEVLGDGAIILTTDSGWQWIAIIWGGNVIPLPPLSPIPGDDLGGDPPPPPPDGMNG